MVSLPVRQNLCTVYFSWSWSRSSPTFPLRSSYAVPPAQYTYGYCNPHQLLSTSALACSKPLSLLCSLWMFPLYIILYELGISVIFCFSFPITCPIWLVVGFCSFYPLHVSSCTPFIAEFIQDSISDVYQKMFYKIFQEKQKFTISPINDFSGLLWSLLSSLFSTLLLENIFKIYISIYIIPLIINHLWISHSLQIP